MSEAFNSYELRYEDLNHGRRTYGISTLVKRAAKAARLKDWEAKKQSSAQQRKAFIKRIKSAIPFRKANRNNRRRK